MASADDASTEATELQRIEREFSRLGALDGDGGGTGGGTGGGLDGSGYDAQPLAADVATSAPPRGAAAASRPLPTASAAPLSSSTPQNVLDSISQALAGSGVGGSGAAASHADASAAAATSAASHSHTRTHFATRTSVTSGVGGGVSDRYMPRHGGAVNTSTAAFLAESRGAARLAASVSPPRARGAASPSASATHRTPATHGPGLSGGPVHAPSPGGLDATSRSGVDVTALGDMSHLSQPSPASNSRAVMAALRTLQDRIRRLTNDKKELLAECEALRRQVHEIDMRQDLEHREYQATAKLEQTRLNTELSRVKADKNAADARAAMHLEQMKSVERELEAVRQRLRVAEEAKVAAVHHSEQLQQELEMMRQEAQRLTQDLHRCETHGRDLRSTGEEDRRLRVKAESRQEKDRNTIEHLMDVNAALRDELDHKVKRTGRGARLHDRTGGSVYRDLTPRRAWQHDLRKIGGRSGKGNTLTSTVRRRRGASASSARSSSVRRTRRTRRTRADTTTSTAAVGASASVHDQLEAVYGGPVPFLPGPNTPTHHLLGNVQINLGRSAAYGKAPPSTTRRKGRRRQAADVPDQLLTSATMTDSLAAGTASGLSAVLTGGAGGAASSAASAAPPAATTQPPASATTPALPSFLSTTIGSASGAGAVAQPCTPPRASAGLGGSGAGTGAVSTVAPPSASTRTVASLSTYRRGGDTGTAASPTASTVRPRRRSWSGPVGATVGDGGSDIDQVISDLVAEYEDLDRRYTTLVDAMQMSTTVDIPLQRAIRELTEVMKRKSHQLDLLRHSRASLLAKAGRSPVRSPGAALQRAEALRTMAHLKHMAEHPLE